MSDTISAEFPFVAELPKAQRKRVLAAAEVIHIFKAAFSQHGAVLPPSLVSKFLGVSPSRVRQLMDLGRFQFVEIDGHKFLTEGSVVEFAKSERKAGRPMKLKTASDVWKASKEYMADE